MGLYKQDSGDISLNNEHVEVQSPYHALQIGIEWFLKSSI